MGFNPRLQQKLIGVLVNDKELLSRVDNIGWNSLKKKEEEEERLKSREIVNKGGKNTNSLKEKEEHNSDSVF